ncbi:hypothetical protein ACFW16_32690 [Inquilinus sp. NPDC058860]|uniref:hypothetical protein n=1 Tax=Inquilinus sp. NPDC058860 TaxID=3346652 RepID=UPI0036C41628
MRDYPIEDVVAVAVAYRARFVARKSFGTAFEAGLQAMRARHPDMPEDEARRAAFQIISACSREHSAFFHYEIPKGAELWPPGWNVDDVQVDEAVQEAKATELRQLIEARRGHA